MSNEPVRYEGLQWLESSQMEGRFRLVPRVHRRRSAAHVQPETRAARRLQSLLQVQRRGLVVTEVLPADTDLVEAVECLDEEQGLATGLASMSQQAGITLGIPIMSTVVPATSAGAVTAPRSTTASPSPSPSTPPWFCSESSSRRSSFAETSPRTPPAVTQHT